MTEFYTDAVKELKNIYDNLNRKYYDNELPEVVITIQSSHLKARLMDGFHLTVGELKAMKKKHFTKSIYPQNILADL